MRRFVRGAPAELSRHACPGFDRKRAIGLEELAGKLCCEHYRTRLVNFCCRLT